MEGGVTLERLVLTFARDGIQVRVLYRTKAGSNPGAAARRREVTELAREGLTAALEALDGSARVDVIGTSGFETREDTLSVEGKAA